MPTVTFGKPAFPCIACGEIRPAVFRHRGRWRGGSHIRTCAKCMRSFDDRLRAERLAEEAHMRRVAEEAAAAVHRVPELPEAA